jgi:hypothetical protein
VKNRSTPFLAITALTVLVIFFLFLAAAYDIGMRRAIDISKGLRALQSIDTSLEVGASKCLQLPQGQVVDCILSAASKNSSQRRDEEDLLAQKDMARWAFGALLISSFTFLSSCAGLAFIYLTFRASAATVSVMRDEQRPWLKVEVLHAGEEMVVRTRERDIVTPILVRVRNFGQQPALFQSFFDFEQFEKFGDFDTTKNHVCKNFGGGHFNTIIFPGEVHSVVAHLENKLGHKSLHIARLSDEGSLVMFGHYIAGVVYRSAVDEKVRFTTCNLIWNANIPNEKDMIDQSKFPFTVNPIGMEKAT